MNMRGQKYRWINCVGTGVATALRIAHRKETWGVAWVRKPYVALLLVLHVLLVPLVDDEVGEVDSPGEQDHREDDLGHLLKQKMTPNSSLRE